MKKLIMLLSVFMVVMTLSACKEKEEDVKTTLETNEKEEIEGTIPLEVIVDEGEKNAIAANAKYEGKIVTIKAYISYIGLDNLTLVSLPPVFNDKGILLEQDKNGASISIPKDEVEKFVGVLSSYVVGDEITLRGYVEMGPRQYYGPTIQLIEVKE